MQHHNPSGNIDSVIGGGDFLQGAAQGLIVYFANHLAHQGEGGEAENEQGKKELAAYKAKLPKTKPGLYGTTDGPINPFIFEDWLIAGPEELGYGVLKAGLGAYVLKFNVGGKIMHYIGKGNETRMAQSIKNFTSKGAELLEKKFYKAKTDKDSFIKEAKLMLKYGYEKGHEEFLNKIWSPGKKYLKEMGLWGN